MDGIELEGPAPPSRPAAARTALPVAVVARSGGGARGTGDGDGDGGQVRFGSWSLGTFPPRGAKVQRIARPSRTGIQGEHPPRSPSAGRTGSAQRGGCTGLLGLGEGTDADQDPDVGGGGRLAGRRRGRRGRRHGRLLERERRAKEIDGNGVLSWPPRMEGFLVRSRGDGREREVPGRGEVRLL